MEPDRRNQVSDLYHAALQRPVEDRSTYLIEACNGDEVLRQEVESLLQYESASLQFLERPAAGIAGALASEPVGKAMVGQHLGPYRIVAPLGAGGMGEVYRAHDSKLGRDVAIKILPSHFTADPERRARFAREARTLATLNHPHIGAIYGLEESDGITALVLELVEGPTLADRLTRGPLKLSEALTVARQIADALDEAHQKGIVHRDLKPANIVLQGGTGPSLGEVRAKVLDFGLAKAATIGMDGDPTQGSLGGTADGRILGTPAYMSPEQARGLGVDKRTDIWAFGCVVFEMLSGRRAFEGETVADTTARILDQEPDWGALSVDTPRSIRTLLERCLRKDTRKRLRDIADASFEIDDVIANAARAGSANALAVASPVSERARRARLVWVAAGTLSAVVAGAAAMFLWSTRGQGSLARFSAVANPVLVRLTSNPADMSVTSAHISPDGRHLAFADPAGLQVRIIDSGNAHRLAGTMGMDVYGWTPDSSGVLASRCDDSSCFGWVISLVGQDHHRTGAVWSRDERVLMAPDGQRLLKHRNAPAGKQSLSVDPMNGLPAQEVATGDVARPSWSADGKHVVFIRFLANTIESVPAEGGPAVEVFRAPKGQLVVSAIELADRTLLISMMPPGSIPGTGQFELWRAHLDRTGVVRTPPRRLTWNGANPTELTVSSNGRVAFLNTRSQSEVYVADGDLRGGSVHVPRRFTLSDSNNSAYTWTPDSAAVLLSSNRHGTLDIFKQRLDSDIAEPFLSGPEQQGYPGVTSDARWVLYTHGTPAGTNIMRTPLSGGATAEVAPHVGNARLQCAQHGRCVLLEPQEGKSFVISSLHPLKGKGNELARIPITNGFRLLPDGDTFAYILPTENGVGNRVRLLSFIGKPDTDIVVKDAAALIGLGWLPSSSGFLTTDRGRLLLVFPDGTSKVLWAPTGFLSIDWAVPSPDERHLVINVRTRHGNVWMLSGF